MPKVDAEEQIDTETWSLRRIIARSEAWDKQRRQEEKQRQQDDNLAGGINVEAGGEKHSDNGACSLDSFIRANNWS
jgi:hypothetical protein